MLKIVTGVIENNGFTLRTDKLNADPKNKSIALADPENRNRVQVRIHGLHSSFNGKSDKDGIETVNLPWAEICHPITSSFGTNKEGLSFVPENDSIVFITLLNNDSQKPIILGTVQGKNDISSDCIKDNVNVYVSRSGHKFTFDNTKDKEKIIIKTKSGNSIVLDDTKDNEKISITDIKNTNSLNMSSDGIDITNENTFSMNSDGVLLKNSDNSIVELKGGDITIKTVNGSVTIENTSGAITIKGAGGTLGPIIDQILGTLQVLITPGSFQAGPYPVLPTGASTEISKIAQSIAQQTIGVVD